jgi:hypothetical protein
VRKDMPVGNSMAQLAHASVEAGNLFKQPKKTPYIYIFEVDNEEELLKAVARTKHYGIEITMFFEPDYPRGYTAAVTEPVNNNQRKIFKKYKLFGS